MHEGVEVWWVNLLSRGFKREQAGRGNSELSCYLLRNANSDLFCLSWVVAAEAFHWQWNWSNLKKHKRGSHQMLHPQRCPGPKVAIHMADTQFNGECSQSEMSKQLKQRSEQLLQEGSGFPDCLFWPRPYWENSTMEQPKIASQIWPFGWASVHSEYFFGFWEPTTPQGGIGRDKATIP